MTLHDSGLLLWGHPVVCSQTGRQNRWLWLVATFADVCTTALAHLL